jgi:hypothetical protein
LDILKPSVSDYHENFTFSFLFSFPFYTPLPQTPYKVADISLADWGRKELTLAENEMPGRM